MKKPNQFVPILRDIYWDTRYWLEYKVFQIQSTFKYALLGYKISPGTVIGGEEFLVEYLKDLAKDIREVYDGKSSVQASQIERWIKLYEYSLTNAYEWQAYDHIKDKYGEWYFDWDSPYLNIKWERDYTNEEVEAIHQERQELYKIALTKQKKLKNLVWKLYGKYRKNWWN